MALGGKGWAVGEGEGEGVAVQRPGLKLSNRGGNICSQVRSLSNPGEAEGKTVEPKWRRNEGPRKRRNEGTKDQGSEGAQERRRQRMLECLHERKGRASSSDEGPEATDPFHPCSQRWPYFMEAHGLIGRMQR